MIKIGVYIAKFQYRINLWSWKSISCNSSAKRKKQQTKRKATHNIA